MCFRRGNCSARDLASVQTCYNCSLLVQEVCGWINEKATVPVWAKMTPNVTDITMPARVALEAGARTMHWAGEPDSRVQSSGNGEVIRCAETDAVVPCTVACSHVSGRVTLSAPQPDSALAEHQERNTEVLSVSQHGGMVVPFCRLRGRGGDQYDSVGDGHQPGHAAP